MKKLFYIFSIFLLICGTAYAGGTIQWPTACFFDSNGDPLSGGKLYSYIPGTSTNKALYSDRECTSAHTNPEILDSNGCTEVYGIGKYKLILRDSADLTTYFSDDNVTVSSESTSYYYPNYNAADHGVTGNSDTIKYAIDTCSTDACTIFLLHNSGGARTEYVLDTDETAGSNIQFIFEEGAEIKPATGDTLTIHSPEHITASPRQQIVDTANNSTDPLVFTVAGTVYAKWFGAVVDGVTDDKAVIITMFGCMDGGTYIFGKGTYLVKDTVTWTVNGDTHVIMDPGAIIKAHSSFPVDNKLLEPTQTVSGDYSYKWEGGTLDGRDMPARSTGAPDLMSVTSQYLKKVHIIGTTFISNDDRTGTASDTLLGLAEGEDYLVHGCYFQGAIDSAIYITADTTETLGRRAIITNNTFEENLNAIITKRQFEDHIFSDNQIFNTNIGIVLGGGADVTKLPGKKGVISGNVLKSVEVGIRLGQSDGTVVDGNRIEDYGVNESGTSTPGQGIDVQGSKDCIISNNVLIINSTVTPHAGLVSIAVKSDTIDAVVYSSDRNLIIGNKIYRTTTVFQESSSDADENVFIYNYADDYTTYQVLEGANSRAIYFDSNQRIHTSFGSSGGLGISTAHRINESSADLVMQYQTPAANAINWIVGDDNANAVGRFQYLNSDDQWRWRAGGSGTIFYVNVNGPALPSYTVSNLPSASLLDGAMAYATNGRKAGEGAGSGTGVMVFYDGSNWIAVDTGATVAE